MSRARLLREIDSQEITDWLAYHIIINKEKGAGKKSDEQTTLREKFKSIMGGRLQKKPKKHAR